MILNSFRGLGMSITYSFCLIDEYQKYIVINIAGVEHINIASTVINLDQSHHDELSKFKPDAQKVS